MNKIENDITIIGGGAFTGFFACFLYETFINAPHKIKMPLITVIEKLSKPFKKISASGNGRCNYSNEKIDINNYLQLKEDNFFRRTAFEWIKSLDIRNFFEENLLFSRRDEYFRLFPYTNSAKTIINFFENRLKSTGIILLTDTLCSDIIIKRSGGGNIFTSVCRRRTGEEVTLHSKILIYAAGGGAYGALGTDGTSFSLLKKHGHSVIGPAPAICALETRGAGFKNLDGLKLEARITHKDFSRTGEILFTNYGISGPDVLYASPGISKSIFSGEKVSIEIDFLPDKKFDSKRFLSKAGAAEFNSPIDLFTGAIDIKFLKTFLEVRGIKYNKANVKETVIQIYNALKSHKIHIKSCRPLCEAQVSLGGIPCDEIDALTLESKIIKNLYIAGEAVDFTGGCGGYNIHFAAACARRITDLLSGVNR